MNSMACLSRHASGRRGARFDLTIVNLERDKAEGETYTQFFMRKGIRGAILPH